MNNYRTGKLKFRNYLSVEEKEASEVPDPEIEEWLKMKPLNKYKFKYFLIFLTLLIFKMRLEIFWNFR